MKLIGYLIFHFGIGCFYRADQLHIWKLIQLKAYRVNANIQLTLQLTQTYTIGEVDKQTRQYL